MSIDDTENYFQQRARRRAEARARREEWDFVARHLSDSEIVAGVGPGWRPLVLAMHQDLLTVDPDYRLYSVEDDLGGLVVVARFAAAAQVDAARRVQAARAQALSTCVLCRQLGRLRPERLQMKTLCDQCWSSDRAAAESRGERYADAVLSQLMSPDRDHPSPDETLAWLNHLDGA